MYTREEIEQAFSAYEAAVKARTEARLKLARLEWEAIRLKLADPRNGLVFAQDMTSVKAVTTEHNWSAYVEVDTADAACTVAWNRVSTMVAASSHDAVILQAER